MSFKTMTQRIEEARLNQELAANQHFGSDRSKRNKKKLPTTYTKIGYDLSTQGPTKYRVMRWWHLLPTVIVIHNNNA